LIGGALDGVLTLKTSYYLDTKDVHECSEVDTYNICTTPKNAVFCHLLQENLCFSLMWILLNPTLKVLTEEVYDYLVAGGSQNYVTLMTVPDLLADGEGNDDGVNDDGCANYDWM